MKYLFSHDFQNKNALNPANKAIQIYTQQMGYKFIQYPDGADLEDKLSFINPGDIVATAYPTFYETMPTKLGYERNLLLALKKKEARMIGLVGDSFLLRENELFGENEISILNLFDVLSFPNQKMANELVNAGVHTKFVLQGLYPYPSGDEVVLDKSLNTDRILYAGNLNKADLFKDVTTVNSSQIFDVYGPGDFGTGSKIDQIMFHGAYPFEQLVSEIKEFDGFGLVWDGPNIPSLANTGRYTRYNYPYKATQYLALNIPLVVWYGSALSEFVIDNNVGIAINNFNDLEQRMNELSLTDISRIRSSTQIMAVRVRSGEFFIKSVISAEMLL
jgi:hypothetical protein